MRIARIGGGRDAARNRAERSGVFLSRPAISIISALHTSGPVRLSRLSDLTDLEAPLVSREIARLCGDRYVKRAADPTDGRATIVTLTAQGPARLHRVPRGDRRHRDRGVRGWKGGELRTLADYLDRVVTDVSRRPQSP